MKRLSIVFFVLALSACSSTQISYDMDKSVDFAKFKTYAFTPETSKIPIQELNRNRLIAATEKQLAARGFSKSENPDVLVDILVKAKMKQEAVTTGTGGYGYGYRYGWGGGGGTTTTQINDYVEGTLFINMISNEKLVWQGRAVKTLDENQSPEKRERNINYAVEDVFRKYPVLPSAKK